jgi:pyruvate, water dikinase
MEPVWRQTLTCDYERTRPDATRLELDLYTRSLISWPMVLFGETRPYGHLRRPGIVDIAESDHGYITSTWYHHLTDPAYVRSFVERTSRDRGAAADQLDRLDQALSAGKRDRSQTAVTAATEAVLRVMSTHIVNWLLPEDSWEEWLSGLLGDRGAAHACLSALMLPTEPGHILAHPDDHDSQASTMISASRSSAERRRTQWLQTALKAAAGDSGACEQVTTIGSLLQWAADSEERRHELRERYLALARTCAPAVPRPFTLITAGDLLREERTPRGAVTIRAAADAAHYGGKASALARLIRGGLPVPEGLVIPPETRDDQLQAIAVAWIGSPGSMLQYGAVVRSSALQEDGATVSFAGLYTSRFTAATPGAVVDAIREVRASAHSRDATSYARMRGLESGTRMSVILQPAIRPYASGVLTGHLREGRIAAWAIQAVYGLATQLVSGSQAGELHRAGRRRVSLDQEAAALPARVGELDIPPGEWDHLPLLDGTAIPAKAQGSNGSLITAYLPARIKSMILIPAPLRGRLLRLAADAATATAMDAIDIEWAVTPDGTIYRLQARPLTVSATARAPRLPETGSVCWTGIPSAPGHARGPVRHLMKDTENDAAGAVLVCANIGPDALRALLRGPAAILTTHGGPLSHAAIVARELGIPCITAMPSAINTLLEGITVSIDGYTGTVTLEVRGCPTANNAITSRDCRP